MIGFLALLNKEADRTILHSPSAAKCYGIKKQFEPVRMKPLKYTFIMHPIKLWVGIKICTSPYVRDMEMTVKTVLCDAANFT